MEYIRFFKSKKTVLLAIGTVIVAGVTGLIFYGQKLPTYKLSIKPTELSPFVSREQARETICNTMKGQLFDEICQQKFNRVGKSDAEKIGALFTLIKKIKNDRRISDYERLLLAQALSASLPTKDSPLAKSSSFSDSVAKIKDFISEKNIAYAQETYAESEKNKEAFQKQILADLQTVVDTNLPGEDNAWVINVSISKYAWVNGERQPLYSEEYVESFDPYSDIITTTGEELENKGNYERYLSTHIRSITSAYATSEAMYSGPVKEGSGEMIAYSFSMMSWQSKPYGDDSVLVLAEAGPGERYDSARHNYTEENYKGEDLMSELFNTVTMPSREGRTVNPQKITAPTAGDSSNRSVPPHGTPVSNQDYGHIVDSSECLYWAVQLQTGIWCYNEEEFNAFIAGGELPHTSSRPPTYPFYDGNQPWQAPEESAVEEPFSATPDGATDTQGEKTDPQPNYDDCERAANGTCIPGSPWTESR